jgi:DNA-binding response OmpR family regulator
MVVEDNLHMRQILSTILTSAGVRHISEASDGHDALKKLADAPVDFVVLDFRMSPMDGVEFTRRVRCGEHGADPYLPIIMMTGHADRARVMEARDAGVTEFVVKPLTAQALFDRINAVIRRPRPFVKCAGYFGPDRRRRQDPRFCGPWRRAGDTPPTTFL